MYQEYQLKFNNDLEASKLIYSSIKMRRIIDFKRGAMLKAAIRRPKNVSMKLNRFLVIWLGVRNDVANDPKALSNHFEICERYLPSAW